MPKKKYTFIDLFAGIGDFHIAIHGVEGKTEYWGVINKQRQ